MILQRELQDRLETWAMDSLGLTSSTKGWLRGDCPLCYKTNTFGIHPEKNRINCFVCSPEGSAIGLFIQLNKLNTYAEALSSLRKLEGFSLRPLRRFKEKEPEYKPVELALPPSYSNILVGDNFIGRVARNYLTQRGYILEELALKGIGYCSSGEYLGYLIMPYFEEGNLVYFTSRQIVGEKQFKNPPESQFGIGKAELIYNRDSLYLYREINILESITNCLTLGDNSIALGGKSPSERQLQYLIKAPVDTYNILLDPDARDEAFSLALQLSNYKNIKLIRWGGEADVNDLGPRVTNYLIKKTPLMSTKTLLTNRLNKAIP